MHNENCNAHDQARSLLTGGDATAPRDLPHSYFPSLESKPGTSNIWQATEVPFKDIHILRTTCQQLGLSPACIFQAAWTLVLRYYIGNTDVCFVCSCPQDHVDSTKPANLDTVVTVCRIDFARLDSPLALVKAVSTDAISSTSRESSVSGQDVRSDALSCNTCVLYRGDHQKDWLESSTLQQRVNHGFDGV